MLRRKGIRGHDGPHVPALTAHCVFEFSFKILLAKANVYAAYNVKKAPSEYCFAVRPEGARVSDAACRYCCATEQMDMQRWVAALSVAKDPMSYSAS